MRTTHERERSEFRRSRCESAQKNAAANRKGGVVSLFSWTFRRREPKARAKPLFFLWRIWELLEDIFSTLKIFMRRFLRSPHLGSSSTGVYLLLNTYISTKGKRKRTHQHARTHARPLAARVVRHDDDDEKKKKKLSSALSRRQTQTGHLAIRGTGETAKREQVFPGLTRNRG